MTDKDIWLAAYLAAIAGGHNNPWVTANKALEDYKAAWVYPEQSEDNG